MKLFIYDHCPYCIKARMIFGLKNVPVELVFLLNDDEQTPIKIIGKKMVPILQKDDGSFMPESMDIIHYIDQNFGSESIVNPSKNGKIIDWLDEVSGTRYRLAMPRWIKAGLPEFRTQSAIDYFIKKKEMYIGSFSEALSKTSEYLTEINQQLVELEKMLYSTETVEEKFSETDIHLFAVLHSLSIVKGVEYPTKIEQYKNSMSQRTKISLSKAY
jgi:glutaredoxin 2